MVTVTLVGFHSFEGYFESHQLASEVHPQAFPAPRDTQHSVLCAFELP